jgi:hypothetical protein
VRVPHFVQVAMGGCQHTPTGIVTCHYGRVRFHLLWPRFGSDPNVRPQNAILDAKDIRRNPLNREAEVRKSSVHHNGGPSATIVPGSYLRVGRRLLMRPKRPLRSGAMCAVLDVVGDQSFSVATQSRLLNNVSNASRTSASFPDWSHLSDKAV